MANSRSILADLGIDPDTMFNDPDKFHEACMENARRLIKIMEGKELPGERLARDLMKAAIDRTQPMGPSVKAIDVELEKMVFHTEWSNKELASLVAMFKQYADLLEAKLVDSLVSGEGTVIRSKRLASYLYQRLRTFHDKWREAQKLFDPEKNYTVIQGKPGNYKDSHGNPFFIYLWNKEEYNFHYYIVKVLSEVPEFTESLKSVKTVADFHEWVQDNPECGVQIMELS